MEPDDDLSELETNEDASQTAEAVAAAIDAAHAAAAPAVVPPTDTEVYEARHKAVELCLVGLLSEAGLTTGGAAALAHHVMRAEHPSVLFTADALNVEVVKRGAGKHLVPEQAAPAASQHVQAEFWCPGYTRETFSKLPGETRNYLHNLHGPKAAPAAAKKAAPAMPANFQNLPAEERLRWINEHGA